MAFTQTDIDRLKTAERDLQLVYFTANETIGKKIPFGIAFGHRSPTKQYELYKKGRVYKNGQYVCQLSNCQGVVTHKDGLTDKSKHNYTPSKAVDIYLKVPGKSAYDKTLLQELNSELYKIASDLRKKRLISSKFRFGIKTQSFTDLPHGEILSTSEITERNIKRILIVAVPVVILGVGLYLTFKE